MEKRRLVELMCPVCGGTQFETEADIDISSMQLVRCTTCEKEMTGSDLINANEENININKKELINETVKEIHKKFSREISDIFRKMKK